jgi:hypothetical protein
VIPKPRRVRHTAIDIFNRELDRALHAWTVSDTHLSSAEARALKLAQRLTATDFSGSSVIQQSLRSRLAERSTRFTGKLTLRNRFLLFRQGHALGSLGMAALLVLVFAVGLLSSQHVSATPVLNTLSVSTAQLVQPPISNTMPASYNQDIHPKPVPTPIALPVLAGNSTISPERTPARADSSLGAQFPIITTTISK